MGEYKLAYRLIQLAAGLGLVASLVACSANPGQEEATVRPTVEGSHASTGTPSTFVTASI